MHTHHAIDYVEFSGDGNAVITSARDSTAKLYPTALSDYLDRACELVAADRDAFDRVRQYCGPSARALGITPADAGSPTTGPSRKMPESP